jgi:superfamily II DNA/RNA helicase
MELESIYEKLQIQDMNQMQKSTYKATENNQDIVLLSPTGSGKTLAFLFPVLRNLKKNSSGNSGSYSGSARELALQIEQVFKAMGTDLKFLFAMAVMIKKLK